MQYEQARNVLLTIHKRYNKIQADVLHMPVTSHVCHNIHLQLGFFISIFARLKNELQKRGKDGKGKSRRGGGSGGEDGGDDDDDDDDDEDKIKKAQSQLEEEKKALLENHSMMAGVIVNLLCVYIRAKLSLNNLICLYFSGERKTNE